jgi:glycosyltransferase involved in cell wall biosynthesis
VRVAHLGPRLARRGGASGYLWQLAAAAGAAPADSSHQVTFPHRAEATPPAPRARGVRDVLARIRRALPGSPKYYRPSRSALHARGNVVDAMMREAVAGMIADARESLDAARRDGADILFAHDAAVADLMLSRRGRAQRVWLMIHTPMPLALYLTWNWGVPETDWREVLTYPDVKAWTEWELDVWSRVDRVIVPCAEAIDELERGDARARKAIEGRTSLLLTGATSGAADCRLSIADARRRFGLPDAQPIGLYLGNRQPYRGFDALAVAAERIEGPGIVAVAGPDRASVPSSARLSPLGPVQDVPALLRAVDFVVNVNRFSLFDLSSIEAAEAGKPLLLHATGGNRTLRDLGCGAHMMDDLSPVTIARAFEAMFAMSRARLADLGAASRAAYERHLTPERCWARHLMEYDRASCAPLAAIG